MNPVSQFRIVLVQLINFVIIFNMTHPFIWPLRV